MPRGERIGDAYIRIHGDGATLADSIRSDLRDAGEDGGVAFNEGLRDGFNRDFDRDMLADAFDKMAGQMQGRLDRLDVSTRIIREKFETTFKGDLGKQMADNLISDLEDGFRQFSAGSLFGDLSRQVQRAAQDLVRTNDAKVAELIAGEKRWEAELERIHNAEMERLKADIIERSRLADEEARRDQERLAQVSEFRNRMWQQRLREDASVIRSIKEVEESLERLRTGHARFGDTIKNINTEARTLSQTYDALAESLGKTDEETREVDRQFRRIRASTIVLTPRINELSRRWSDLSDTMGRFSGRGSRNNFLNFIGSVNRNFSRLVGTVVLGSARMTVGLVNFARALPEALSDPKLLAQMGANFGAALANAIPTIIALTVTVALLTAAAGVLAAALSGLAGILTALLGTVAFAAAAAIPALAAAFLPLIAVIGTVTTAFQALDDAQANRLHRQVQPLVTAFQNLGNAAQEVLFRDVGEWARKLAPLMEDLEPGIVGVARAIRDTLGDAIDSAAESPKMDQFIDRMNVFLPNAVRKAGEVFTNVFEAMGGIILAMLPSINRFLNWLVDITDEFSNWANRRKGREEIRDFFEKAGDSAKALGDFLEGVVKFFGELLDQSRQTGDNIFRDMAGAFEDMVGWLRSPEGKRAMADWLEFAEDFSKDIGEVLVAVKDLMDALDDENTREAVGALLDLFVTLVGWVVDGVNAAKDFGNQLGRAAASIERAFETLEGLSLTKIFTDPMEAARTLLRFIGRLATGLSELPVVGPLFDPVATGARTLLTLNDRVRKELNSLPPVKDLFDVVKDKAVEFAAFVGGQVVRAVNRVPDVKNIFATVIERAGGFLGVLGGIGRIVSGFPSLPNIFSAAVNGASSLIGLLQFIMTRLSSISIGVSINWPDPPGWLDKVTASGGIFSGAQTRIIGEAGAEAVVPLQRPLNLVDPSVRWLSAIAQGKVPPGPTTTNSRTLHIEGVTVMSNSEDPKAVAQEFINLIVAQSY